MQDRPSDFEQIWNRRQLFGLQKSAGVFKTAVIYIYTSANGTASIFYLRTQKIKKRVTCRSKIGIFQRKNITNTVVRLVVNLAKYFINVVVLILI